MYKGKTFIGIIPARSGSKVVPDKNIRAFLGKPLMAWTILAALESGVLDEVFVSTDSEKYAQVAREYGASAPFLRPPGLSGDESPASEYVLHALTGYRERQNRTFDYFILLQPTSPLRTPAHIRDGVRLAVDNDLASVVSFSPYDVNIRMVGGLSGDMSLSSFNPYNSPNDTLRQDGERLYMINGMIYIGRCNEYAQTKSFYGPGGMAMIIDGKHMIDIDDETDFCIAEYLAKQKRDGGFI